MAKVTMEPGKYRNTSPYSVLYLMRRSLHPENERVRNELENLIFFLSDKKSIPALINLLDDDAFEVRWIAAESLIRIGRSSVSPLLRTIREGRRFNFPAKPYYVLQNLLNRREKKEFHNLLICLANSDDTDEISDNDVRQFIGINDSCTN